jgi:hypothetical protein
MCFFPFFSNNILANVPKIINYYLDSVVTFKAVRFFLNSCLRIFIYYRLAHGSCFWALCCRSLNLMAFL